MSVVMSPQESRLKLARFAAAFIAGAAYGLVMRLLFGAPTLQEWLSTLSVGFLFLTPVALGAVVVYLSPAPQRTSFSYAFFAPWLPGLLFFAAVTITALEVVICLLMASPIYFLGMSLGGVIMAGLLRLFNRHQPTYALAILVIAPYLFAPVEGQFRIQDSLRLVHTETVIHASKEAVWKHIIRVPKIQDNEQHFSIFHVFGLPRPVEATLSEEEIGGVRAASFDNGLRFLETVTAWEPYRKISFKIKVIHDASVPPPFGAIGGKAFDVLDGTYIITPLPDGTIRLNLDSTERVSTNFNFYSGWWTDTIMADLQNYILVIVKARAEAEPR